MLDQSKAVLVINDASKPNLYQSTAKMKVDSCQLCVKDHHHQSVVKWCNRHSDKWDFTPLKKMSNTKSQTLIAAHFENGQIPHHIQHGRFCPRSQCLCDYH